MRLKLFKLWIKNVLLKYFLLFKYFEKYVFIQTIYSIDPFEVKRATSHKWQFDSGKYEWNVKVTDSKRKKEKYSTNITENKMNQEIKRGVRNLDKSQSQFLFGWDRDASSLFFFTVVFHQIYFLFWFFFLFFIHESFQGFPMVWNKWSRLDSAGYGIDQLVWPSE